MNGLVVGVVAKAPVAGLVKTRLCPPLTPVEAAAVATALLRDVVGAARAAGVQVVVVDTGDRRVLRAALPRRVTLLRQRGTGLAARLAAAQSDLFACGADRVVLLGADCASVDGPYLARAAAALDHHDAVLGPAHDGGYTLLGARRPTPGLFEGVPMSTDRAAAVTIGRATTEGVGLALLPPRSDVDTAEDLIAAHRAGELARAPATLAVLAALGERLASVRP